MSANAKNILLLLARGNTAPGVITQATAKISQQKSADATDHLGEIVTAKKRIPIMKNDDVSTHNTAILTRRASVCTPLVPGIAAYIRAPLIYLKAIKLILNKPSVAAPGVLAAIAKKISYDLAFRPDTGTGVVLHRSGAARTLNNDSVSYANAQPKGATAISKSTLSGTAILATAKDTTADAAANTSYKAGPVTWANPELQDGVLTISQAYTISVATVLDSNIVEVH